MTTVCQNTPDAASKDIQSLSDGFYYKTRQSWQKLEPLAMAGGGLKHMGKMFDPGLTPQMVWTFRDAESPVRITDKRPTFYIRELPRLADIAGRTYLAGCLAAGSNSPAKATNRARFMRTKVENTASARTKKVASLTKPGINYAY
jgi:hypothetical protein